MGLVVSAGGGFAHIPCHHPDTQRQERKCRGLGDEDGHIAEVSAGAAGLGGPVAAAVAGMEDRAAKAYRPSILRRWEREAPQLIAGTAGLRYPGSATVAGMTDGAECPSRPTIECVGIRSAKPTLTAAGVLNGPGVAAVDRAQHVAGTECGASVQCIREVEITHPRAVA